MGRTSSPNSSLFIVLLVLAGVFSVMDMYYAVAFLLSGGGVPALVALGKGRREKP